MLCEIVCRRYAALSAIKTLLLPQLRRYTAILALTSR